MSEYRVIGIMSGTSMDGVDLAFCTLKSDNGNWTYKIEIGETIPYESKWRIRLSQLRKQPSVVYVKTDTFYGHYLGQLVNQFIKKHQIEVDFIASHGHTIFHMPEKGYTAQIGSGAALYAETGIPVICDFRSVDVGLGGHGAPLVAIGDRDLFNQYDYVLNLGGIANISAEHNGKRIAYDISPCNIILNRVARNMDLLFDEGGKIAQSGSIHYDLLKTLNQLSYYKQEFPKSLGREWINSEFWPITRDFPNVKNEDLMKTFADHIAGQIAKSIDHLSGNAGEGKKMLVTGGGAYNQTLIELIQTHSDVEVIVPQDTLLIEYKEALLFAYLGCLRISNKNNCLGSATGAKNDNIGGALYGDFSKITNHVL